MYRSTSQFQKQAFPPKAEQHTLNPTLVSHVEIQVFMKASSETLAEM